MIRGSQETHVKTHHFSMEVPIEERTWSSIAERIASLDIEGELIRLILVDANEERLVFEASFAFTPYTPAWPSLLSPAPIYPQSTNGPSVVVNIIPTGVRADIGGFAGDATPSANLLAATCDYLVTNPNTVTASDLYYAADNIQYLEGNLICRFLTGQVDLLPGLQRKLGILIEKPVKNIFLNNVLNAINAMRTVGGLRIEPVMVTEHPIKTYCEYSQFGHAIGRYGDLDELMAGLHSMAKQGVGSVGLSTTLEVPQEIRESYYAGDEIPNPWGSAEAILTHLATTYFPVTSAHSPLLLDYDHTMFGTLGDPRDGAELISSAFLCSMIRGLSKSPGLLSSSVPLRPSETRISVNNVRAVVLPESVVGNIPFLAAIERHIPVILVRGNKTISDVTPKKLGLEAQGYSIYTVDNYMEAAGCLLALEKGIEPTALRRPFAPISLQKLSEHVEHHPDEALQNRILSVSAEKGLT